MKLKFHIFNRLDNENLRYVELEPIKIEVMKDFLDVKRMKEINRIVCTPSLTDTVRNNLYHFRLTRVLAKYLRVARIFGMDEDKMTIAYNQYLVIKAIEVAIV